MSRQGEDMEYFKHWRPNNTKWASKFLAHPRLSRLPLICRPGEHEICLRSTILKICKQWSLPVKFGLNGANLDHVVRLLFLQSCPFSVENNRKTMGKSSDRIKGPHVAGPSGSATTLKCCFPWLTSASPWGKVRATSSFARIHATGNVDFQIFQAYCNSNTVCICMLLLASS